MGIGLDSRDRPGRRVTSKERTRSSPAHGWPPCRGRRSVLDGNARPWGTPVETLHCNVSTTTGDGRGTTSDQRPGGGGPREHRECGRSRRGEGDAGHASPLRRYAAFRPLSTVHRHDSFLSPFVVVPISAFNALRDADARPPARIGRSSRTMGIGLGSRDRPGRRVTSKERTRSSPAHGGPPWQVRRSVLDGNARLWGRPRRDVAVQRLYRDRRSARDDRRSAARQRRPPRARRMRSGGTAATVQDAGWRRESPPSSPAHGWIPWRGRRSVLDGNARPWGAPVETLQCNVSTAAGDRRGTTGGQRPASGDAREHRGCGRLRRGEACPRALPIQAGPERPERVVARR
jgi:hypothetical protein